jgi:hypothetical protein
MYKSIYMVYTALYIQSIYMVYTLYIQGIYKIYTFDNISICNVYTLHIHCICGEYAKYIMYIYSTRWLMLWRRTESHSTGSTSNYIAWTNKKIYFATFMQTLGILAPARVDAQGAHGTVNSWEVPCLTGKTYKTIFLDLCHFRLRRGPKDKDNQTNS